MYAYYIFVYLSKNKPKLTLTD